ncbi:nudix hydrolase [Artemisia annua]|uniref:Nudix hydrolase n=1 Tax=Artemisia annua TaxID=35608 RepID=A0A2U1NU21_ARTAN|nr:nudix hydrolase [Artemisia annua]
MGDGDDDHHQLHEEEEFDILTKTGLKTGFSKPRSAVHRDGDYHRAVHVWIFAESTQQLLLQKRADFKDSWPGLWDISNAGHVSAGDTSLITARRELQEELGVTLPNDAFELLFVFLQEWSCLDENEAFLTTADSAVRLLPEATKQVAGWKGVEYKAAFPILKPPGASFNPPDMDKMVSVFFWL